MDPRKAIIFIILLSFLVMPVAFGDDDAEKAATYDLGQALEKGQVFTKTVFIENPEWIELQKRRTPTPPAPRPKDRNAKPVKPVKRYKTLIRARFHVLEAANGRVTKYKVVLADLVGAFNGLFTIKGMEILKGEWAILKLAGDKFNVEEYSEGMRKKLVEINDRNSTNGPMLKAHGVMVESLGKVSFDLFQRPTKPVAIGETWKGWIRQNAVASNSQATFRLEKIYETFKSSKNLPYDLNVEHISLQTKTALIGVSCESGKDKVSGKILFDLTNKRVIALRLGQKTPETTNQAVSAFRYFPKTGTHENGLEFRIMATGDIVDRENSVDVLVRWRNLSDKPILLKRKLKSNPYMNVDSDNLDRCIGRYGCMSEDDKEMFTNEPYMLMPYEEFTMGFSFMKKGWFMDDEAMLGLGKGVCNINVKSGVVVNGEVKQIVSNTIRVMMNK